MTTEAPVSYENPSFVLTSYENQIACKPEEEQVETTAQIRTVSIEPFTTMFPMPSLDDEKKQGAFSGAAKALSPDVDSNLGWDYSRVTNWTITPETEVVKLPAYGKTKDIPMPHQPNELIKMIIGYITDKATLQNILSIKGDFSREARKQIEEMEKIPWTYWEDPMECEARSCHGSSGGKRPGQDYLHYILYDDALDQDDISKVRMCRHCHRIGLKRSNGGKLIRSKKIEPTKPKWMTERRVISWPELPKDCGQGWKHLRTPDQLDTRNRLPEEWDSSNKGGSERIAIVKLGKPLEKSEPEEIIFYEDQRDHFELSTLFPHAIIFQQQSYPTAEHLYQSRRFRNHPEIAEKIRTEARTPKHARYLANKNKNKQRNDWEQAKTIVMEEVLRLKFKDPELQEVLKKTGNAKLVAATTWDSYWGINKEGKGRNELGKMLMKLRDSWKESLTEVKIDLITAIETNLNIVLQEPESTKEFVVQALIDCGATISLIHQTLVKQFGIKARKLEQPISVFNVDGTPNKMGEITHYTEFIMKIGQHQEKIRLYISDLGRARIILGHRWLNKHNPEVDWKNGEVKLTRCPEECHFPKSLAETSEP